jgi:RNA polymerase sigma factor (sigma-70 family)
MPAPSAASAFSPEAQARFRDACEAHLDFVWRFARACGVEASALESLVRRVFSIVQGRLISLDDPSDLRVSLAGIARQVVRSHLRGLGSPLEVVERPPPRNPSELGAIERLETKTAAELVDVILSTMSEAEREVFILCELEGFTLVETAGALHVGESTLRVRLDEARKLFNDVSAHLRAQRFWVSRGGTGEP